MKTTIEIPDELVQQIELRASHENRELDDVVADLIRRGLEVPEPVRPNGARTLIGCESRSGLPLIRCQHPARPHQQLTPERVANILLEQELAWQDE